MLVDGVAEVAGEKVFALKFLQGRNPEWLNHIFFAKYDEKAAWLNQLEPAFGEEKFFFEDELAEMKSEKARLAARKKQAMEEQLVLADLPN